MTWRSVNVPAVANLDDHDHKFTVLDQIEDPVVTLPNTVFSPTGELLTSWWPWFGGEGTDFFYDSLAIRQSDFLDLLGGGTFDRDPIVCHLS